VNSASPAGIVKTSRSAAFFSADCLAAHGKPLPLRVRQSKSLAPELLLRDTVPFLEIVDDRILLTGDPTGHGGHEALPGAEYRRHPRIVAKSKTDRQQLFA